MFARRVFQAAALWGLVVIPLGYAGFLSGHDQSLSAIARPEIVHGFFLVTFAWQLVFGLVSIDPARYRLLMPLAVVEKLPFAAVMFWLFARGEVDALMLFMGAMDALMGILFALAFLKTSSPETSGTTGT